MQRERRHDPYPWTWEIPAAVITLVLLIVATGAHLGRSAANLLAGAGWTWPTMGGFFSGVPGVLGGHAAAGLPGPGPGHVAGPVLVWVCTGVAEALLWAPTIWVSWKAYRRWGPGQVHGVASRAEAEALLGVTRLRKAAPVVRPDLYAPAATGRKHRVPRFAVTPPEVK